MNSTSRCVFRLRDTLITSEAVACESGFSPEPADAISQLNWMICIRQTCARKFSKAERCARQLREARTPFGRLIAIRGIVVLFLTLGLTCALLFCLFWFFGLLFCFLHLDAWIQAKFREIPMFVEMSMFALESKRRGSGPIGNPSEAAIVD